MTTKQKISRNIDKDQKLDLLKIIKKIRFTEREIDVIACLLGGRSYKKIAALLSISPKTVELHVRNIMLRIGCSSKEGIIDFIEKSDKFTLVKNHYVDILIKVTFEHELKKLAPITNKSNLNCLIFHSEGKMTKSSFIFQLERSLNISGVKVASKTWVKDKTASFLTGSNNKKINCVVYILSGAFIKQLNAHGNEIAKEISGIASLMKDSDCPIVFVSLDADDASLDIDRNCANIVYIKSAEYRNNYFLFFDLLEKILPKESSSISANIDHFKRQYEALQSGSVLQNRVGENEDASMILDSFQTVGQKEAQKNSKHAINKKLLLTSLFFLLIISVFFIKLVFVDKIAHKSQNIGREKQQKTILFNLPPRNSKFIGRDVYLEQIKTRLDQKNTDVISQQVISGLGGVGKTQLATEFAYQAAERNNYKIILWIGAETENTINGTYKELADFLQIDIRGLSSDKTQTIIHKELIKRYHKGRILFIIDNAPNHVAIRDYLVSLQKQFSTDLTLHILLTSRSQHWPGSDFFVLDNFTPQEAVMYVKKYLPNESEKLASRLAQALHHFPLALSQATAYVDAHTSINDYLELYLNKQEKYLDKFSDHESQYKESLWKTWHISLAKLNAPAREMLFISSYLYPDDIPLNFFDNLTAEEKAKAVKNLRKHSFIIMNNNGQSFNMHRLLQEVVRKSLASATDGYTKKATNKKNNEQFVILTKSLKLLRTKFSFDYINSERWSLCDQYLTHAQNLAEHLVNAGGELFHLGVQLYAEVAMHLTYAREDGSNAEKAWEIVSPIVKQGYGKDGSFKLVSANIYTHLSYVMRQIGDMNRSLKFIEQAIAMYDSKISSASTRINKLLSFLRSDKNTLALDGIRYDYSYAFYNLGLVKQEMGYFADANKAYKIAFDILEECKNKKNTMVYRIFILGSLGSFYMSSGNIKKAWDILSTVSAMVDKYFSNHLEQSHIYAQMAYLQYYLGKYNEAKVGLEKTLKIRLSVFSKEHYRVAAALELLGMVSCAAGYIDEGVGYLRQAEAIYNKSLSEDQIRFFYIRISYALEMHREYDDALEYLIKAQRIAKKRFGEGPYSVLKSRFTPIEKLPYLGLSEKNINYYTQALDLIQKMFGVNHVRTARYHYLLGQVFENLRNKEKARYHYQQALAITNLQSFDDEILITGNQCNAKIIQERLGNL